MPRPPLRNPLYHIYDRLGKAYGTADDFKELASACHEKGIRLIIDVAMNHSSSQHPWFTQACEYLAGLKAGEKPDDTVCPYVDYYHFSDKQEGTTYYAVPGSSSWWYEGSFWSEMPDLNLKSPAVQKEFEEVAAYRIALSYRIDQCPFCRSRIKIEHAWCSTRIIIRNDILTRPHFGYHIKLWIFFFTVCVQFI